MIDNEIIKALGCCSNQMYFCTDKQCKAKTLGNAVDLIKSQKAEIEELQSQIDVYANKIKSEAYKEFAEKVKDIAFTLLPNDTARDRFVLHLVNLLKEMVGEEE